MFPILAGSNPSGYNLTRSLRFRSSASAYLSRTLTTPTNNKIWTYSLWVKRGKLGATQTVIGTTDNNLSSGNFANFRFTSGDTLEYFEYSSGYTLDLITTQVFRDPSAWYHIILSIDTTQATAANRVKLYVNGSQVTAFGTATYPSQNYNTYINSAIVHYQSAYNNSSSGLQAFNDIYFTEVNFIDGQALTPSSFGSTNALTGVWQPARYTGTYGTNGFYLPFTDNSALTTSSNVGLGKDFSGNGNYWTTNNISITAGVTYDSMTDVPTLTSATAANFAVLNPLDKNASLPISNGNLTTIWTSVSIANVRGTIALPTAGKYYWETVFSGTSQGHIGVAAANMPLNSTASGTFVSYAETGLKYVNGSSSAYGASFTAGDIIGVAYDAGASTVTFYKNNTSQGAISLTAATTYFPLVVNYNATININFGQRPFSYTPPTGFVALNTFNLPTSTIVKGNTVMDATLYSGNSSATQTIVNAAGFQPDAVWLKSRSTVDGWAQVDSVRGVNKLLQSNNTNAESTTGSVTAFNSNGFTADINFNVSGRTYVGYQWQAGQGTTSSNTNGTITSTVSVNASAGFSVVTWSGNNTSGATVGHSLGVAPALIIIFARNNAGADHRVYSSALGATKNLKLNTTDGQFTQTAIFNDTAPTSSVFSLGNDSGVNGSYNYVAYCWTPIAGYSAFGSYTGNGSTDGVFVYTGFQPKWVLVKKTSATDDWVLFDSVRSPYNVVNNWLLPNSSGAELTSAGSPDLLSNGFKMRSTSGATNGSGATFIYMAFAENPFKNALAR